VMLRCVDLDKLSEGTPSVPIRKGGNLYFPIRDRKIFLDPSVKRTSSHLQSAIEKKLPHSNTL
jgi:hypothetical protein